MNIIETCVTPKTYEEFENNEAIVIIIDILRATSAICTAFMNGAKKIIPVRTLEEAKEYKSKGYMIAAERDGFVQDFADFGNSPFNFTPDRVQNNTIVYSTTNGTNTIMLAKKSFQVLIGSYLNLEALKQHIVAEKRDVLLLCASWKNKFSLEDTVFAGALAESILEDSGFSTQCDSTKAAIDLWSLAKPDLVGYINKSAQKSRLAKSGLDDCIEFCHSLDKTDKIPVLTEDYLTILKNPVKKS